MNSRLHLYLSLALCVGLSAAGIVTGAHCLTALGVIGGGLIGWLLAEKG